MNIYAKMEDWKDNCNQLYLLTKYLDGFFLDLRR